MRLDKVWIVARKDMSEFRTNKYIIFSLAVMPIVMSFVLPVVYLLPFTILADGGPDEPIDLRLNITRYSVGMEIENATVYDTKFIGSNITSVFAQGCVFERCNITSALIRDSFFLNSTVDISYVIRSNLENTTRINSALNGCVIIGEESEAETYLGIFVESLIIFIILSPAIIPTVIASYSFVGEKLNKSLEPLLATPTTDLELLAGKSLSIFLPSMLVTWISFIPFVVLVDLITEPVLGYYILPNPTWVIASFALAPLVCLLSISANVLISARVTDVRASQQLGSLVVLPIVIFFIVAIAGLVTLDPYCMTVFTSIVAAIDAVIVYLSLKVFRREEILIRWK